jgi:Fe-S-cluster containining protein
MKLILNSEGKVDYDNLDKDATVRDVLEAIDIFLSKNPLPCNNCEESCCKRDWSVEVDNVCVNRLSGWSDEAAVSFVQDRLVKKKNYAMDFNQYVLVKEKNCSFITEENLCTIYENRPIICRLYICTPKSYRYNLLRQLIGSTYLKALILEDRQRNNNFTKGTINKYKRNPAFGVKDYDIFLEDIFIYGEEQGWLDFDEKQELYRL